MITTSDIILKLIKQKGYKNQTNFCEKTNISRNVFNKSIRLNSWTKEMLERVGKALGKDLLAFVTAQVGVTSKKCL